MIQIIQDPVIVVKMAEPLSKFKMFVYNKKFIQVLFQQIQIIVKGKKMIVIVFYVEEKLLIFMIME